MNFYISLLHLIPQVCQKNFDMSEDQKWTTQPSAGRSGWMRDLKKKNKKTTRRRGGRREVEGEGENGKKEKNNEIKIKSKL